MANTFVPSTDVSEQPLQFRREVLQIVKMHLEPLTTDRILYLESFKTIAKAVVDRFSWKVPTGQIAVAGLAELQTGVYKSTVIRATDDELVHCLLHEHDDELVHYLLQHEQSAANRNL